MAKTPTFRDLRDGIRLAQETEPIPHLRTVDGRWSPIGFPEVDAILEGVRRLIPLDMEKARADGYAFAEVNPLDLLSHPDAVRTPPTLARWIQAIDNAAEENRFK